MRMSAHDRAVEQQPLGVRQIARHNQEDRLPIASLLPPPKPLIHGIPVPETLGKIPPRNSRASHIQNRIDEVAIGQIRRRPGWMLYRVQGLGDALPNVVGHPHSYAVHGDLHLKIAYCEQTSRISSTRPSAMASVDD